VEKKKKVNMVQHERGEKDPGKGSNLYKLVLPGGRSGRNKDVGIHIYKMVLREGTLSRKTQRRKTQRSFRIDVLLPRSTGKRGKLVK